MVSSLFARLLGLLFILPFALVAQTFEIGKTYKTDEARQAVAVDEEFFYAIDSYEIAKYDKATGERLKTWKAEEGSHVKHLNSGKIVEGKLYCAHSNYPAVPRISTIEMWDANSLAYLGNKNFGDYDGAANIILWYDNSWWVLFAHYSGDQAEPSRSSADTRLDRFDKDWKRTASYTFPQALIDKISPKSISGADWGTDGLLYCTGHDEAEVYQMKLPADGQVMEFIKTIPAECEGQGVSFDDAGNLWTIKRKSKTVVVSSFKR